MTSFLSDNNSGVHPRVLDAIMGANVGTARGYGDDVHTDRARERFREQFGASCHAFFVFGGTGGNVVGLQSLLRPFEAVICAESAHIAVDECGAPERAIGCKLLCVPHTDGKITTAAIAARLSTVGVVHRAQPKVVSLTQATEYGTVYTAAQTREIADFTHSHGLYLHMDGARFANAAAAENASLADLSVAAGVDVLTFGGTKNGLMGGEAVLVFDEELARQIAFLQKQSMQLPSKMRFLSAQFVALLTEDLWRDNARNANRMARLLALGLGAIPGVKCTRPTEANMVFATLPREMIEWLRERYAFYVWNPDIGEVRLVCSFDTTAEDIEAFVAAAREGDAKRD